MSEENKALARRFIEEGRGANDLLCGGNGNDKLTGGRGADHFGGGFGTDTATDFNASQGDTEGGIP
jgi:Ca2+-binding RTX toxin-like protein